MQIQSNLGSTIAMAFDECPPALAEREYVEDSVARTTRWLERCKNEMQRLNGLEDTVNRHQMLFGINQGAIYTDIRIDHAKRISEMDLDGYAVGGLAVGETHEEMYHVLDETVPYLPVNKPTYLMGVGTPANILEGVERGIDFFDCVYPSRNGRHGHVYTNQGKINLFNAEVRERYAPDRGGLRVPDLPPLQQSLYPPSAQGKRDAWHALMCSAQSVLLQHDDGRDQGCAGCRKFCLLQGRKVIRHGTDQPGKGNGKVKVKGKRLAKRRGFVYNIF